MNKLKHATILAITLFLLVSCGEKTKRESEALSILEECARWFITKGFAAYNEQNNFDIIQDFIESKGAHFIYKGILPADDRFLASASLGAWWVVSNVTCFERVQTEVKIYEYWAVPYESKRTDFQSRIHFLIAEAEGLNKERRIIYQSDIFFPEYKLPNGVVVKFPIENTKAINALRPWNHPVAFKGSTLEGFTSSNVN